MAKMRRGGMVTVLVLCIGQAMFALDLGIVAVALPAIGNGLGMSVLGLQWVVTSLTLTFGGLLVLGGRVGDIAGRKRMLSIGLGGFALASATAAVAWSGPVLIVARVVQGSGAALIFPAALSAITTVTEEGRERGWAMSVWSMVGALASIGGFLAGPPMAASSWRWVFVINAVLGAAGVLLTLRYVPADPARDLDSSRRVRLLDAALLTAGVIALVYAIVQVQRGGSPLAWIVPGLVSVGLLGGFVALQRRPGSLVPLNVFRARGLAAGSVAALLSIGGLFVVFVVGSLYAHAVGLSPAQTGYLLSAELLMQIVANLSAPWLIERIGTFRFGAACLVVAGVGLGLLATLPKQDPAWLLPCLVIFGLGFGGALIPTTVLATGSVPVSSRGLASGVFSAAQQIGGAAGLALALTIGALIANVDLSQFGAEGSAHALTGYGYAFMVVAVLSFGAAAVLVVAGRRRPVVAPTSKPAVEAI